MSDSQRTDGAPCGNCGTPRNDHNLATGECPSWTDTPATSEGREEFEKWAKDGDLDLRIEATEYEDRGTFLAYEAWQASRASDRERVKELMKPLKEACDRSWEDETPEQIVVIAANAIHWRQQRAKSAESRVAELQRELAEARFSPMGDNHHNAAACPYCRDKSAESRLSTLTGLLTTKDELIKSLSMIVEIMRAHSPELARKVRQAAEIVSDIVDEDGLVKAEQAEAIRSHLSPKDKRAE